MTKNPETNEVVEVQQTHYYPFGGIIADISWGRDVQKRLFNGKELDTSSALYWYDYGARLYDATRCQFTGPDQMAEKYYEYNSYAYCNNSPINRIDVLGLTDFILLSGATKTIEKGEVANIGLLDYSGFVSLNKAIAKTKAKEFFILLANTLPQIEITNITKK